MKLFIKGSYRKNIFKSDKNYVIGLFKVRETNDPEMELYVNKTITFTGYFYDLNEDDTYLLYGEGVIHPRYGFQYQVKEYERVKPEGTEGLVEFLSSSLFKGVGVSLARNIVMTLGEQAVDIIIKDPSQLLLVPKMSSKKAKVISDTLINYEGSRRIILALTNLGFNMREALSIYGKYKEETMTIVDHNLYDLVDDIDEITFVHIDALALKMNYEVNDERRVKATIIYVLNAIGAKQGDTYLTHNEVYNGLLAYLKIIIDYDLFSAYLNDLVNDQKLMIIDDQVYLMALYQAEINISQKIKRLNALGVSEVKHFDAYLKDSELKNHLIYNKDQATAIKAAVEANVLIITGGPGTGKTTIIRAITELYQTINHLDLDALMAQLALLAPTGRASKRMSEATMLPATTIHRFLRWNKEANTFSINENNPANVKLVIIDEFSMIDTLLLDNLFKGLNDDIKLIIVGDYNQLPSVGSGQILKDLIDSAKIKTINLEVLYRQSKDSYIPSLAKEIKDNHLTDYLIPHADYQFIESAPLQIRDNLLKTCQSFLKEGFGDNDIQVMAPMYKGENGIDNLNSDLQQLFNPPTDSKKAITYGEVIFREHDKVLQLVNMPDDGVFNGDIGIITNIILAKESDSKKNEVYVNFDGNTVKYLPKDLIKLKHGYAISIHKSQGSEFPLVIMIMSNQYGRMLYRKLVYTGVTRAKKKLVLIGEKSAFTYSVANNNEYKRKTGLLKQLLTM